MLVRRVVDDEFGQDPDVARMGSTDELLEILHRPVVRVEGAVLGDVVAIVALRRWIKREQPEAGHAQRLQVVELLQESTEIAEAVVVGIVEGFDRKLIENGVLVPEGIVAQHRTAAYGFGVR